MTFESLPPAGPTDQQLKDTANAFTVVWITKGIDPCRRDGETAPHPDRMDPAMFCAYVYFALVELGADARAALHFVGLHPGKVIVHHAAGDSPATVAHILVGEIAR
jgi:hypothetical protein